MKETAARRLFRMACWALLALGVAAPSPLRAAERSYVIAVGHNGLPGQSSAEADGETLRPLRFADDDAANVFDLFVATGSSGTLLTTLDADTQRRHPSLVDATRPPTLEELRSVVKRIAGEVAADVRAGASPTVVFFYSGHGFAFAAAPALALHQGALTTEVLYEEVIRPLAAARLHVLVDACHAEAVVRPRDLHARVVDVNPAEAAAYVRRTTLAQFPGVGAIIATTRGAQSHEWDTYGAGIFTHQLISGLRGGADVDGNELIEYSELAAFLSAANRNIIDPRARLDSVVHAPQGDRRAPLIDLRRIVNAGRLRGRVASLGGFHIEDDRGVRILDMRAERSFLVTLVVPAGRRLFVRSRDAELDLLLRPGQILSLDRGMFQPTKVVARGALESALRRGLFATGFGPGYYLGFVDGSVDGLSVPLADDGDVAVSLTTPPKTRLWRHIATWMSFGASAALGLGALVSGAGALSSYSDVNDATYEVDAVAALDRYVVRRDISLMLAVGAAATGVVGLILWRKQPAGGLQLIANASGLALTGTLK